MSMKIFVNHVVNDLEKSKEFWTKLGFTFNPQFEDEGGVCLIISENIYAMLLTREKFQSFTDKQITDTSISNEVSNALSMDSKEAVDELVDKAVEAGATEPRPAEVYDFMYGRGFYDLDGHAWDFFWMDPQHK